jgi:hypothetical protein
MTGPQESDPAGEQSVPITQGEGAVPDLAPTAEHPVSDAYVARRLAEGAAARAEAERREAAHAAEVGEAPPQGAFAFYILLGIVISILLLLVIYQMPGRSPAPPTTAPGGSVTSPR